MQKRRESTVDEGEKDEGVEEQVLLPCHGSQWNKLIKAALALRYGDEAMIGGDGAFGSEFEAGERMKERTNAIRHVRHQCHVRAFGWSRLHPQVKEER